MFAYYGDEFGWCLRRRKGITPLVNVLESWCKEHLRYSNATDGDTIFGNTEISNVAALSTAASKEGWLPVVEFTHRKGPAFVDNLENSSKRPGRCDLFLEKGAFTYLAEAKLSELSLDHESDWTAVLDKCWKSAVKDAERTKVNTECDTLAICFWKFYLPVAKTDDLDTLLDALIKHLKGEQFDATAWVFPEVCEQDKWGDGFWYPGAAMAIQKI